MSSNGTTVNIILFKGPHCATCKPVERHLKRIVETSKGGATMKTIDTEEHSDIAIKYGVHGVPHVLYNDEIILTAQQASGMLSNIGFGDTSIFSSDQYDLFNYLFNKLIEAGVRASEADRDRWRKLSIITVSERLLDIEDSKIVTRPSVGDYVHIGHLQSIVTSLLAINPSAKGYLYRAGEMAGKFGAAQSWLGRYNPKIMTANRMKTRFKEMLKGFEVLYGQNPMASKVASKLSFRQVSDNHAILNIKGSAHAVSTPDGGVSDIGQDVCGFLAGEIAGLLEVTLGEKASVVETKCWGLGNDHCEFDIILGETSDHYTKSMIESKEFFSQSDRIRFELTLANISQNMFRSILRGVPYIRQDIGDYIHISVLQHILTSLKFSDPFNSTLLAYAGMTAGQMLEDGSIIDRILRRRKNKEDMKNYSYPMEFPRACEVLGYYFNEPIRIFGRIHATVTVDIIDEEEAFFKVWESAATSGIDLSTVDLSALFPGIEKPPAINTLDDFMAGFINGRLDLLVEDDVIVRETKCQANGYPSCEFVAELD
ncbi:MAG: V4R domain-containing protein [Candidatus Hodarchaeota archaeon]